MKKYFITLALLISTIYVNAQYMFYLGYDITNTGYPGYCNVRVAMKYGIRQNLLFYREEITPMKSISPGSTVDVGGVYLYEDEVVVSEELVFYSVSGAPIYVPVSNIPFDDPSHVLAPADYCGSTCYIFGSIVTGQFKTMEMQGLCS